ncbi:MAG: hypothetical protein WBA88_02125 [Pseudaminobacter sp.]
MAASMELPKAMAEACLGFLMPLVIPCAGRGIVAKASQTTQRPKTDLAALDKTRSHQQCE